MTGNRNRPARRKVGNSEEPASPPVHVNDKQVGSGSIELPTPTDKSEGAAIAELRISPFIRHGTVASCMAAPTVKFAGPVSALDASGALKDIADKVATGDLRYVGDTLLSQSIMLDTTSTELMRRAWLNAAEYPEAFNRYMTLALKTQAQSRVTLEALVKLHQPREQVVRHVHVYEGGQAMVAEQLHVHGPGGVKSAGRDDQCQATRAADLGDRAQMLGEDASGQTLPFSCGSRQKAMPHARR